MAVAVISSHPKIRLRLFHLLVKIIFDHHDPKVWIEENIFERSNQKLRKPQAVFEAEKNGYSTVMSQEVSAWQEMIRSMVVRITRKNNPLLNRGINWGCQSFPKLLWHLSILSKADFWETSCKKSTTKPWVWMMLFQIPQIHQLLEEILLNIFPFSKWQCSIIEQSPQISPIWKYRKRIYWTFESWPKFIWFSSKLKHIYVNVAKKNALKQDQKNLLTFHLLYIYIYIYKGASEIITSQLGGGFNPLETYAHPIRSFPYKSGWK